MLGTEKRKAFHDFSIAFVKQERTDVLESACHFSCFFHLMIKKESKCALQRSLPKIEKLPVPLSHNFKPLNKVLSLQLIVCPAIVVRFVSAGSAGAGVG